jgi:hypothetical protein
MSSPISKSVPAGPPTNVDTQHVTFAFTDDQGRSIGYLVTTSEIDMVPTSSDAIYVHPIAPGHYFALDGHYTVKGKPYGVSPLRKLFRSANSRSLAIDTILTEASDRAFSKTREGLRLMKERRQARLQARLSNPKLSTKKADKITRRNAKEAEAAAKIPAIEAEVQAFLNDSNLMEYLASHPWPLVIPGPPSMDYTAYTHIVTKGLRRIEYALTLRPSERPKASQLSELKNMLRVLKEQAIRIGQRLPPDSPSDRKLLGYR